MADQSLHNVSSPAVVANAASPTRVEGDLVGLSVDLSGNLRTVGGGSAGSPSITKPGGVTLVTLDIKTVTTGGTAVIASLAGHHNAGGFITNPKAATIDLGINEIGTATGTVSNGDTTFIAPGQSYTIAASSTSNVSVISSDSAHTFSGVGYN